VTIAFTVTATIAGINTLVEELSRCIRAINARLPEASKAKFDMEIPFT
jgi:hypothetical protein